MSDISKKDDLTEEYLDVPESYIDFAHVYDELMDETPYNAWLEIITDELTAHGINDGLVLDLGCGTGTMTELLADKGYDMTGVDLSEDMLDEAIRKREQSGHDILYLCQDMREFELYGTVRAVISVCDSLNYLLLEDELLTVFKLVNNYLDPGGIFIFDVNTPYKYREIIGDSTIAENRDDCSFIWENFYDEETGINEYIITLYTMQGDGLYKRTEEQHLQKGYDLETIKKLLEKAGMVFIRAFDTDSRDKVTGETQRFTVVAKEKGK